MRGRTIGLDEVSALATGDSELDEPPLQGIALSPRGGGCTTREGADPKVSARDPAGGTGPTCHFAALAFASVRKGLCSKASRSSLSSLENLCCAQLGPCFKLLHAPWVDR